MRGVGLQNFVIFVFVDVTCMFSSCKCMCFYVLKSQTRHQNGDTHFLTLDEILDETKLLDISMKQKHWLMNEVCLYFLSNISPILPVIYYQKHSCHLYSVCVKKLVKQVSKS